MAFITIVGTDEAFPWTPIDDKTGQPYESSFSLRIVPDEKDEEFRRKHTRISWDKHRRVEQLNQAAYAADLIDYAIVTWSAVKDPAGAEVVCTPAMKARLPEKWKAEILRLCSLKEAGEVLADQEKKLSKTI